MTRVYFRRCGHICEQAEAEAMAAPVPDPVERRLLERGRRLGWLEAAIGVGIAWALSIIAMGGV